MGSNRKSIVALALAGAFTGTFTSAHAQSSVTLFGVVDIGVTHLSTSAAHQTLVESDGNTSSRLGFRGQEDLGGGNYAGFWLEAAVAIDTGLGGTTNAANQGANAGGGGLTFGRRSTVHLGGHWGELRLGRDYTPTFLNLTTTFTPFGTNGVGDTGTLFYPVAAGGTTPRTNVRASNAIEYVLPAGLGGFYGQAMYALGEQPNTAGAKRKDGTYTGARIGWKNSAFNIAGATGTTKYSTGDFTQQNVGVSYEWKAVKLMYLWGRNKVGVTRTTINLVGATWDIGPGEARIEHARLKGSGGPNDATHTAVGYVWALSKRTAVYSNYAVLQNKGAGNDFDLGLAVAAPGGSTRGLEIGVRHSF